jgi:hypothetical protein
MRIVFLLLELYNRSTNPSPLTSNKIDPAFTTVVFDQVIELEIPISDNIVKVLSFDLIVDE